MEVFKRGYSRSRFLRDEWCIPFSETINLAFLFTSYVTNFIIEGWMIRFEESTKKNRF